MINDDTWLQDAIAENNCLLQNESTFKPFAVTINKNGVQESMNINLSMAKGDQLMIITTVLIKLREWVQCATTADTNVAKSFKPLRVTIRGSAGSGKSFFVKCIANTVNTMLSRDLMLLK